MTTDVAIQLRNVSKAYEIYKQPSDRLKQMVIGDRKKLYKEFWAIKQVDLDIYKGEAVGIVGRNGSGKSTLLQVICGTLKPTQGSVRVNGRIAALLELGSGFNKEFTGRENVYMNATILGLSQEEVADRYDRIAAFADIGEFIDQPAKTYSSGMYMRLAFAVAINVDPDILVIDEALAVGDEAFKRKCFSRIEEIRKSGSTILFVSHSVNNVIELCDRAILMDRGKRLLTSDPKTVASKYQKLAFAPANSIDSVRSEIAQLEKTEEDCTLASANTKATLASAARKEDESDIEAFDPNLKPQSTVEYIPQGARITNARILNKSGQQVNILKSGVQYTYTYDINIFTSATNIRCGMLLKTTSGVELGGMSTHPTGQGLDFVTDGTTLKAAFKFTAILTPGTYFLNAGLKGWTEEGEVYLHRLLDAVMFRIEPYPNRTTTGYIDFSGGFAGSIEMIHNEQHPAASL
jgi:lipopolysaccharide transport system ATP-binding protein